MILRGTFLARETDLDWFFFRLKGLFPSAWRLLSEKLPGCSSSVDLIDWYYNAVHGDDSDLSMQAAWNWSAWGSHVVHWHKTKNNQKSSNQKGGPADYSERLLAKVKIETHYAYYRYFMNDNELLQRIDSLPDVPVTIVHGVFDLTCAMESAWLLHQAIPGSRLIQLEQTGHLIDEPAMISTLVEETDRFRALI
jgi:proline iminopeptidase